MHALNLFDYYAESIRSTFEMMASSLRLFLKFIKYENAFIFLNTIYSNFFSYHFVIIKDTDDTFFCIVFFFSLSNKEQTTEYVCV